MVIPHLPRRRMIVGIGTSTVLFILAIIVHDPLPTILGGMIGGWACWVHLHEYLFWPAQGVPTTWSDKLPPGKAEVVSHYLACSCVVVLCLYGGYQHHEFVWIVVFGAGALAALAALYRYRRGPQLRFA